MSGDKAALAHQFFGLMESQVQFGDNKASLLVAGDAILLAITGELIKTVSGCGTTEFTVDCAVVSVPLVSATVAALGLITSLTCALWAARPAAIHGSPPRQFFLFSYLARIKHEDFVEWYRTISDEELLTEALRTIHSKAAYATRKFRWLKSAIHATLFSLVFVVATVLAAAASRILG